MKSILQKYREMIIGRRYERHKGGTLGYNTDESNIMRFPDGSIKFLDIDYASNDNALWDPYSHLSRIETLLLTCGDNVKPFCKSLLKFWFNNDFKCPNWWYNEILKNNQMDY